MRQVLLGTAPEARRRIRIVLPGRRWPEQVATLPTSGRAHKGFNGRNGLSGLFRVHVVGRALLKVAHHGFTLIVAANEAADDATLGSKLSCSEVHRHTV